MSQFKPGDPALLLIDIGPVSSGSVVELISRWPAGTDMKLVGGGKAECAEDSWVFSGSSIPAPGLGFAPERCLMPLRGDFAPEQKKSREVVA
jgi:hypothetical protein